MNYQAMKRQGKNFFFSFFRPCQAACGILLPQPGIEPVTPELGAWNLNHWTAREVLAGRKLKCISLSERSQSEKSTFGMIPTM